MAVGDVCVSVAIQVFGSPKGHPKVKPFVDHILSFFIADNRIWVRNYQSVNTSRTQTRFPSLSRSLYAFSPSSLVR